MIMTIYNNTFSLHELVASHDCMAWHGNPVHIS